MSKENIAIVYAGVGDDYRRTEDLVEGLNRPGLTFHVSRVVNWKNSSEKIAVKMKRILEEVDELSAQGDIFLVGISGSANLVGLVYLERREIVKGAVGVCGRLRSGGIPPLWLSCFRNPAFRKSVQMFERKQKELTTDDRRRFLIFQAGFDELVPRSTSYLQDAKIITLPAIGHMRAIRSAFLDYGDQMIDFI